MEERFGRRLRRERERRQITLESIAADTKISASLFAGLERDDISRWPSGIFRRAFIRAYADAIGLDADAVTLEFLTRFPDPAVVTGGTTNEGARTAGSSINTVLRLTLADGGGPFTRREFLSGTRRRLAAIWCDAAAVTVVSVVAFLVLRAFWMPLALSTLSYYAVGILVLGTTPGVCLFAPGSRAPRLWDRGASAQRPSRRQASAVVNDAVLEEPSDGGPRETPDRRSIPVSPFAPRAFVKMEATTQDRRFNRLDSSARRR